MILLNQAQHLGRKAYLLMAAKRLKPGLIMLVIAVILLSLSGLIAQLIPRDIVGPVVIGVFVLAVVACLMSVLTARAEYKKYTFTFEEFGLKLTRGTFKIVEVTIPYRQMQDIAVERGMVHQMTGTSKLIINTASDETNDEGNETDIVLDPIQKETAEEIRLMLLRKIGVQVTESEEEADREAAAASAASVAV